MVKPHVDVMPNTEMLLPYNKDKSESTSVSRVCKLFFQVSHVYCKQFFNITISHCGHVI